MPRSNNTNRGSDAFTAGANLLANVGGIAAVFFLAPMLFHGTIDAGQRFALVNYGYGWDALVAVLWAVGCAFITFAGSKMILAVSLRLGAAALAELLFGRR